MKRQKYAGKAKRKHKRRMAKIEKQNAKEKHHKKAIALSLTLMTLFPISLTLIGIGISQHMEGPQHFPLGLIVFDSLSLLATAWAIYYWLK